LGIAKRCFVGAKVRQINAKTIGVNNRTVMRVVEVSDIASQWKPDIQFLVRTETQDDLEKLLILNNSGLKNLVLLTPIEKLFQSSELPKVIYYENALEAGDVVAVSDERRYVHVLFRETDIHHTVFLTNRCNSYCLMCSQPPTPQDDSWLINEAKSIAEHMRISPALLGFTGGEPLLLGSQLRDVFDCFVNYHPNTEFDLLTNGRFLADEKLAKDLLKGLPNKVTWMVPLYGHTDFLHDFVVQSPGAFEQTLEGMLVLQSYKQSIQLRIVLIEPVLKFFPALCEFVGKNLPFVREVAIMGCEPIGFALANKEQCQVDLNDWFDELVDGVLWLRRYLLTPVIMNTPLCALPRDLWPYAHQSISDWKRVFVDECKTCTVKDSCSGLFSWYDKGWTPTTIKAVRGELS
jgi:His-Xaa-Ser system radical SAM maturase HxsC